MGVYAGLDVSLDAVSICVVGETGEMLWQGKVLGEPEAVKAALDRWGDGLARVGLEAGATSEWIGGHLVDEGFPVVCLESRHVKAALSAMAVKTDRNDAHGIAQIVRTGWFKTVHLKSAAAHPDGGKEGGRASADRQRAGHSLAAAAVGYQDWRGDARAFRGQGSPVGWNRQAVAVGL